MIQRTRAVRSRSGARWLFIAALAVQLGAGCERSPSSRTSDVEPPVPAALPSDLLITLERTECYATCPSYVVTIDANGLVTWTGRENVDSKGEQSFQIPLDSVQRLLGAFDAMSFEKLDDEYSINVTDMATVYLGLRRNGRDKRVQLYWTDLRKVEHETSRKVASQYSDEWWANCVALSKLAIAIDEAADSQRWIKPGPPEGHR